MPLLENEDELLQKEPALQGSSTKRNTSSKLKPASTLILNLPSKGGS
uniref:Uncharacterized protein n=1 Tax=Nelumbo nucifera TaxID=4432 RepID=A0A822ZKB8_NELNU|nr:TPA_asm: hypothetical protein HUJ06_001686 [Nelumbo nucifera]